MKTYHIRIVDARRRAKHPEEGMKTTTAGYRVQSVAKNGEILAVSEVLNTPAAVKKNISAMQNCWESILYRGINGKKNWFGGKIVDHTKKQSFAGSGYANIR